MDAGTQLAALSDPTRRLVFGLVRDAPRAVGEIARLVPVSRPAVSQHLRVLVDAGLVSAEKHGTRRIYSVDPSGLRELRDWVETLWEDALDAFEGAARKEHTMQASTSITSVTKIRLVPLAVDEAFDLFTRRMGDWWPVATHSIAGRDVAGVRFEGKVGGRVVEIAHDGTERSWADVLAWDPPHRFVLSWHPSTDPVAASTLEVRFTAAAEGKTEIMLEHRGWEEFGAAGERLRGEYHSGWDVVLRPFEEAAGAR